MPSGFVAMGEVRRCVQEIISAHVITKDQAVRDDLISEYTEAHGEALLRSLHGFYEYHIVRTATPAYAEDRFFFILTTLGNLLATAADAMERPVDSLAIELAEAEIDTEGLDIDDDAEEALRTSFRAAQTCVIAHVLVRDGHPPFGIQRSLELEDMCVIVERLGDLMLTVMLETRRNVPDSVIVRHLLGGIERILEAQATALEMPLSRYVSDYWTTLLSREGRD